MISGCPHLLATIGATHRQMRTSTVPLFVLLATSLAAQSNSVNGLDGRLTVIDNMSHYGRRGPAQPNGEIGMAMLNTMCNPGSVDIP